MTSEWDLPHRHYRKKIYLFYYVRGSTFLDSRRQLASICALRQRFMRTESKRHQTINIRKQSWQTLTAGTLAARLLWSHWPQFGTGVNVNQVLSLDLMLLSFPPRLCVVFLMMQSKGRACHRQVVLFFLFCFLFFCLSRFRTSHWRHKSVEADWSWGTDVGHVSLHVSGQLLHWLWRP